MQLKPTNAAETLIAYAIEIGALELLPDGRELKSGRISPYFFNSGLFCTGSTISHLARAYAAAASEFEFESVFGPAYKGIPLATAVAQAVGGNIGYSFDRKEAKDHGEGGIIVGANLSNKRVLIVDDVMTTGLSSGGAVDIVCKYGGIPVAIALAFDRQEQGKGGGLSAVQEFEQTYKLPVRAAATLTDLINLLERSELDSFTTGVLDKILSYHDKYGV